MPTPSVTRDRGLEPAAFFAALPGAGSKLVEAKAATESGAGWAIAAASAAAALDDQRACSFGSSAQRLTELIARARVMAKCFFSK
jgi:hypothetical protein